MILHEPERTTIADRVRVSARVEFRARSDDDPAELFFEFPAAWNDWLSDRSDAFVTALVLPAMQRAEELDVRGSVSARLVGGLAEYQRAFQEWFPWRFRCVPLNVRDEVTSRATGDVVASAFSGGVDSFYSLWSHLPPNDSASSSAATAAIFIHGFDIPLANEEAYREAADAYRGALLDLGVSLVEARTNAQDFAPPGNWGVFHGAVLVAVAHALGRGLRRLYVPASHTVDDLVPWGSDPRIDPLLSTETLDVVHDGARATRVDKTRVIGRWPPTFGRLRVCAPGRTRILRNCCRCEKCIRTMIALDLFGDLRFQSSFPLPLERRAIRACSYHGASDFTFPRELILHAWDVGRRDVVVDLAWAVARSRAVLWARRLASGVRRVLRRARRRRRRGPPGSITR